ncbi:unnamed protein product [Didymodactylos carnosus]|uniref:MULE transposase domain-containing protein n=1 Tax=Didymodactylos carnosus TaxID=1234261 RepID=A0A8S2ETV8_9BILA|nr:unnamed protein product [Didymodactylos carnosus]CAF4044667.1 unnamed protein product [Didymodactylos carnosus]
MKRALTQRLKVLNSIRNQSIPESDDTPPIVKYQMIYDDDDNDDIDDNNVNENKFRFFVATKRLQDLDRHLHSLGMAICSNEKTQEFMFVLRGLQEGIQKLSLEERNPDVLIVDGADSIRNALQDVLGKKPMVMCRAHMCRNVVKKIESIVDKSEQVNLVNDNETLQVVQSERIFIKASNLSILRPNLII